MAVQPVVATSLVAPSNLVPHPVVAQIITIFWIQRDIKPDRRDGRYTRVFRHSGSPPSSRDPLFNMMGQPPRMASVADANACVTIGYLAPRTIETRPESLSPPSPFTTPTFNDPFRPNPAANYASTQQTPAYAPVNPEVEIRRLRKKLRETEQLPAPHRAHSAGSLPSPLSTPPSTSAFQASWKARTDARIRQFCALNRAGNALCAWHDSRRERRVHPPRMAPSGYLNCGCTYEEALFEESLARHHVGSYLPGETVRMDPALRNPLLKLLQQRYGYKDGDFERDPRTGDWIPGEGHAYWEQQIQAGVPNPRRERR
ncbi:hypothetical protein MVEN_02620900 [Mycena venus]|uniref:Uncharacterized protein n=1 Tax=Mycena venus TaxID=2733690 RepID=A0A8H6U022_9AGAR|nr:hypothetical protein MVEN_02620900 [Mycena venus]